MQLKMKIFTKIILIIVLFLFATFSQAMQTTENEYFDKVSTLTEQFSIEKPVITNTEAETTRLINPSHNTYLSNPCEPKIPVIKKTYTFPKETRIHHIKCIPEKTEEIHLLHSIEKTPVFHSISGNHILSNQKTTDTLTFDTYPERWFTTQIGAGITSSGNHVIHVTITLHPYMYHPKKQMITYASNFTVKIKHSISQSSLCCKPFEENHQLVIITPEKFISTLNPLLDHKNQFDLNPLIKTTSDIYNQFNGRDKQEKIKYFVKHAIETYNTQYVLLIGNISYLPIRTTDAYPWGGSHDSGILSDLYYADVYNETYSFSSWDTNNNDVFGEVNFDRFPPMPDNIIDDVDLYPDVHIGRIPCSNDEELKIVISKIINYETSAAYQNWFKKIVLAGGDTFPLSKFHPPNIFEGEITNIKVGQQLPDFKQIKLWASERNLNALTFNNAISEGVGFVSYAGHGFEHGWGTYRPNTIFDKNLIWYFTPFLKGLTNEYRLPVVFFDACLTSKLDFNISDFQNYFGIKARLYAFLFGFDLNEKYFPSFSWAIIKKEGGGAIATVGATRSAYTYVNNDGVHAGAGYLDFSFFNAYEEGITVGEMLSIAQTNYLNNVGKDMFTIEEYLLFGDPSLRVGGYS